MVRHSAEIGWTPLSPSNALTMRGGEAGLLFRGVLEEALRRFDPWMTEDAVRSVVENLQALPPTIEGNRQMLVWLRGERQWYDEAEQRHRQVRLIDFDTPVANVLHVTWEWKLKPPARKGNRADVMFVVNGVPVAIVEHKNPTDADAIERGVTQLRRYEMETPEMLGAAQLFNVTHVLDYWYGVTWNLSRRYMARWKESPEESYRFAVQSFFEPTDFLRTLRDWILFYVEDGEMRKTVLRQHQRRAVDRIVERCAEPVKRRGRRLAHPRGRQDLHAAHGRPLDIGSEGGFPQPDGRGRRGPHGAGRSARRLGGAAARRDAATGHRRLARQLQGRAAGVASYR